MGVTKTKAQALKYLNSLIGRGWDFDGRYGLTK
nr:MAG TPA: transcriptional regulator [Herelleviridae sp.]